ncbi:MAG: hypothetical protein ACXWEY_09540 [Bacteroidia bacterium]
MKFAVFLLFVCLLSFSCQKEEEKPYQETCIEQTLTDNYLQIWKDAFKSQNKISDDYFDKHIFDITPSSSCSPNGAVYFKVYYKVKIEWAEMKLNDVFEIKYAKDDDAYKYLDIPRDSFLRKDHLVKYFKVTELNWVDPVENLKFKSRKEADKFLQEKVKDIIGSTEVFHYEPGDYPRYHGYPYLRGSGEINWDNNECFDAMLNLVTGEWEKNYGACRVE